MVRAVSNVGVAGNGVLCRRGERYVGEPFIIEMMMNSRGLAAQPGCIYIYPFVSSALALPCLLIVHFLYYIMQRAVAIS